MSYVDVLDDDDASCRKSFENICQVLEQCSEDGSILSMSFFLMVQLHYVKAEPLQP